MPACLSCCHSVFVWTPIIPALCHIVFLTWLCLSWPSLCAGSHELACWFACHWRVRWRSHSHMSYLQRMNWSSHPDVRGWKWRGWETFRKKDEIMACWVYEKSNTIEHKSFITVTMKHDIQCDSWPITSIIDERHLQHCCTDQLSLSSTWKHESLVQWTSPSVNPSKGRGKKKGSEEKQSDEEILGLVEILATLTETVTFCSPAKQKQAHHLFVCHCNW